MRNSVMGLGLAAVLALSAAAGAADETPRRMSAAELGAFLHQAIVKPPKPGASSASRGDDSCRYANDRECDEPDIGTGACDANTDYSDCRFIRFGETDDCEWAADGECDEPGLGTGACTQGTDRTDCAAIANLRFQTDSCDTAMNGICEDENLRERRTSATCEPRTDRADCVGRERPMTINDHFQGYDDRVFLDASEYPWSAVGLLEFDDDSECTGTLVASDIVITAAHCVHDGDGRLAPAGKFASGFGRAGGPLEARITGYFVAPRFSPDLFYNSNKLDGTDWAYLRLSEPLGDELGVVGIEPLLTIDGVTLDQAGYSWDTAGHLSGHLGCEAIRLNTDGTLEHHCDTTRGDSGSPLMIHRRDAWSIVAVDSNYRDVKEGPVTNIAASAVGFVRYLEDFRNGVIGEDLQQKKGKLPGPAAE
jgi:protease YdgD